MNITITFRHVDASEAIKRHATDKCAKLQKFLRRPMTAKVTLSLDKLKHVAETRISSGSEHFEAREETDDMYASIDRVMEKLERQISGSHGAAQAKKRRGGATLRGNSGMADGNSEKASPARRATRKSKPAGRPATRAAR